MSKILSIFIAPFLIEWQKSTQPQWFILRWIVSMLYHDWMNTDEQHNINLHKNSKIVLILLAPPDTISGFFLLWSLWDNRNNLDNDQVQIKYINYHKDHQLLFFKHSRFTSIKDVLSPILVNIISMWYCSKTTFNLSASTNAYGRHIRCLNSDFINDFSTSQ